MKITHTNLYTMAAWIVDGKPARVASGQLSHLRRCAAGGLISDDFSTVTPAGLEALRASRCKMSAKALACES